MCVCQNWSKVARMTTTKKLVVKFSIINIQWYRTEDHCKLFRIGAALMYVLRVGGLCGV